jgi:hypothetical protein
MHNEVAVKSVCMHPPLESERGVPMKFFDIIRNVSTGLYKVESTKTGQIILEDELTVAKCEENMPGILSEVEND